VTGAARGIGRGIALLLAQEGAKVVVCDIGASLEGAGTDAGPAQDVVKEIKAGGGEAIASTLSIAEPKNADEIVKAAVQAFGRVDILVNNAGILRDRIFHRMSHVDWKMVIDVHLNGAFNVSRAAANHFKEQKSGAFVHFTSTSGLVGNFGQANYSAAKMGIIGLSRSIALDMAAFNVRSNCISPFAWTRMIGTIPADTEAQKARLERSKKMTPAKIAPMAVFLLSDAADGITSQIFGVRMNEIMLFNANRPVRSVHNSEGWTLEAIAEQAVPSMKPYFTDMKRSPEYFTWDPV
jgi:NAD(P)-dependent dehydrogenase (short-subunit alcohol dehydrogenase family)